MTEKISITLDSNMLAAMRVIAKKRGASLSAVMTDAARALRQQEARDRLMKRFGTAAHSTPKEAKAIRAEWAG